MYNSLLDGCAQNNLVEEGLNLLDEMQASGVIPSNFTLSILVKLMNRSRKLEQAFSIVEQVTTKFRFKPNTHVYNNLMQACISNKNLQRAMSTFETMLSERVHPDARTYTVLARGCISSHQCQQACGLIRGALALPGALSPIAHNQSLAAVPSLESSFICEILCALADRGHGQDLAVPLLAEIKQSRPRVRIDATTAHRLMTSDSTACARPPYSMSGKGGKGKSKGANREM
eukprot:gnl/TRDRNA2_/TRDRNA2_186447_c0_seq1.p1 gnl/TRDRNA2_/TRDRNA2_186447_c0~~gnl/TRDRNA2_/TRDRNA2_186447_c0_seq1.p1  ORF type:complete len:231 (-),score=42.01 gnl/TRDRNA2_/TRDRNA2_186447_c0_seq1:58-750(-)